MKRSNLALAVAAAVPTFTKADGDADTIQAIAKKIETFASEMKSLTAAQKEELGDLAARMKDAEQKLARRPGSGGFSDLGGGPGGGADILKAFLDSPQLKALQEGADSTGRVSLGKVSIASLRKDLTSTANGDSPQVGFPVLQQRYGPIANDPRRRFSLLDALPRLPVSSNTFEFISLNGYVNAANFQGQELDLKSEGTIEFEPNESKIVTIAHWIKASNQVLADAPVLQTFISSLMAYGVVDKFEAAIVAGDGSGGGILGIAPQATEFVATATAPADRIGQAAAQLAAQGWTPGLVIMHPNDWFAIASERATGGDSQYVAGGWSVPTPPTIWGLPVVTTPSMVEGTALVLDPNMVLILDREQPVVAMSRETGDNFIRNATTILGEMRGGLAVLATAAVLEVNVEAASGG